MDGGRLSETNWLSTGAAASACGVHSNTLRSWADRAVIDVKYTPGGQRRFDVNSLITKRQPSKPRLATNSLVEKKTQKAGAIYCRVSSSKQKDDLERQVKAMQKEFPLHRVYEDVGSGLNYKRKGLTRLLEHVQAGVVKEVVVAHRDRLARFGVEIFEWIISAAGASLVFLDQAHKHKPGSSEELAEDLLAVVHVFSCRINGKRRYKKVDQKGEDGTQESLQGSGSKRKKTNEDQDRYRNNTARDQV